MRQIQWLNAILLGITIYLLMANPCTAITIDKMIIFGDSMSDNGNLYTLSSTAHKVIPLVPVVPMDPPYYEGRFSNGPVWNEILSKAMNVELENYAYGGAWVEPLWDSHQLVPFDLATQINFYLASGSQDSNKDKHLYVIWAGANDYTHGRSDPEYATSNTVAIIKSQIEWLIYYGAKQFLILTIPDMSLVPEISEQTAEFAASVRQLSQLHNTKILSMVADMQTQHPDLKFITYDITNDFNDIVQHPEKYHLENSKDACYKGDYDLMVKMANVDELQAAKDIKIDIMNNPALRTAYLTAKAVALGEQPCDHPDTYLFWDHIHPTRIGHEVVATFALSLLNANDIKGPIQTN